MRKHKFGNKEIICHGDEIIIKVEGETRTLEDSIKKGMSGAKMQELLKDVNGRVPLL